jgi:sulfur carrier protein ThiS
MRLHLGGHLNWYAPQKQTWVDVPLTQPTRLIDVLKNLGVPMAEIAVGTLNGVSVFSFDDVIVRDADTLELFPPVGGG